MPTLAEDLPRSHLSAPRWAAWLGFVVLCNGVGFLSSLAGGERPLYASLERPDWAPPGWVFGPAWTTLYTLMGTATYLVWSRCKGPARRTALTVFGVQLALNAAWSPTFFGLRQYGLSVLVIALVLAASITMMVVYFRRVRLAGWLTVPLVAWVSFASAVNTAVWWLNR